MKPTSIAALLVLFSFAAPLAAPLVAQKAPEVFYAESFRHGSTHITDASFEVKLNPQNSVFFDRIKDTSGTDRYLVTIVPQIPEGEDHIISWQVRLTDLHHLIYNNVLLVTQEPSSDPRNTLWWLNPSRFSRVPALAQRIMKVDGFYVLLQITAYHFTPLESPYLDSMTVQVKFSNSDPRIAESTPAGP
ncbi:MAG TPA: hypothetical protein VKR60_16155 [Candidatus Sulfotelmatobacter sp.]|nr:hypothetical protein [Candidatus Sulfotelmatobacter sp.]